MKTKEELINIILIEDIKAIEEKIKEAIRKKQISCYFTVNDLENFKFIRDELTKAGYKIATNSNEIRVYI